MSTTHHAPDSLSVREQFVLPSENKTLVVIGIITSFVGKIGSYV